MYRACALPRRAVNAATVVTILNLDDFFLMVLRVKISSMGTASGSELVRAMEIGAQIIKCINRLVPILKKYMTVQEQVTHTTHQAILAILFLHFMWFVI